MNLGGLNNPPQAASLPHRAGYLHGRYKETGPWARRAENAQETSVLRNELPTVAQPREPKSAFELNLLINIYLFDFMAESQHRLSARLTKQLRPQSQELSILRNELAALQRRLFGNVNSNSSY